MNITDLKDKNIAIWGLGVEGRAVLDRLNKTFPNKEIVIIDNKNLTYKEIISILKNTDIVIRSPGVSIYKDEIILAKKEFKTQFITEKTLFFSELACTNVKTIAITGTKGKTTTSTFCAYLLEKLGYKVLLAGNIGVPTLELLDEAKKCDFVIVEISSYQASDLLSFPSIAILLNLFPEHINWHLTHENYYKDKCNLILGSENKIVNGNDSRVLEYTKNIDNKILFATDSTIHYENGFFYDNNKKLFSSKNMKLLGEHNYQNICSVLTALKILNISLSNIKQEYFDNFQPVEHRLETINYNGILFINDSISTIPEATIACYNIFKEKNIYGILGGFDRQQDYGNLVQYIINNKNIKYITLLGETGKRISQELLKNNFKDFKLHDSLKDCVQELYNRAKNDKDAVVTLSPASASYDMYKNFEERGNDFKNIIKKLK